MGKVGDTFKDYYPIGTLENARTVLLNKPDDFLFVSEGSSFDAVFVVDQSLLTGKTNIQISPDTFISVKRFANIDLAGKAVKSNITSDPNVAVIRSAVLAERMKKVVPAAPPAPTPAAAPSAGPSATPTPPPPSDSSSNATPPPTAPPAAAQPTPDAPISNALQATAGVGFLASDPISLGTTNTDGDAQNALVAGGSMNLKGTLIAAAKVDPTATLSDLAQGPSQATKFYVPDNRTMIQVAIKPYETGWNWLNSLSSTQLVDTNGNTYPPNGFYALARSGSSHALLLRYDATHSLSPVSPPDAAADGNFYLLFLIPHETDLKVLKIDDKQQSLGVLGGAPMHVQ